MQARLVRESGMVTVFSFEGAAVQNAPLAQLVEQLTLNQWVLGSSPRRRTKRPVGQVVKTAASHAANGSSTLPRVTTLLKFHIDFSREIG